MSSKCDQRDGQEDDSCPSADSLPEDASVDPYICAIRKGEVLVPIFSTQKTAGDDQENEKPGTAPLRYWSEGHYNK